MDRVGRSPDIHRHLVVGPDNFGAFSPKGQFCADGRGRYALFLIGAFALLTFGETPGRSNRRSCRCPLFLAQGRHRVLRGLNVSRWR